MEKRGQVTMFIILGLVVLLILLFAWVFKDTFEEVVYGQEGTKRLLNEQLSFIEDGIKECVDKGTLDSIRTLLMNGGTFNIINSVNYDSDGDGIYSEKVRVLCSNIVDSDRCLNNPVLKSDLEKELKKELISSIKVCIEQDFISEVESKSGYTLEKGSFNLNVEIGPKKVLFNITYPLKIIRKDIEVYEEDFSSSVEFPLKFIVEVVNHILNEEALGNEAGFDEYSLNRKCKVISHYVGSYKIYEIKSIDYEGYPFWFAIEEGS
jgi:hypothetical protein